MSLFRKTIPTDVELHVGKMNPKDTLEILSKQIATAYANLNYVTDPVLIDSWIYEINAASLRYEYILSQIKQHKVNS